MEDVDNDGSFDKKTLFIDKLTYVTGIETGFGARHARPRCSSSPTATATRPRQPARSPRRLRPRGQAQHRQRLRLGPDGWLYAGHGRTSISDIGPRHAAREADPLRRRRLALASVARPRPSRRHDEPVGVAFDRTASVHLTCVDVHLHAIQGPITSPGATVERHAYKRIDATPTTCVQRPLQTS
jgi:hypothetical protein